MRMWLWKKIISKVFTVIGYKSKCHYNRTCLYIHLARHAKDYDVELHNYIKLAALLVASKFGYFAVKIVSKVIIIKVTAVRFWMAT